METVGKTESHAARSAASLLTAPLRALSPTSLFTAIVPLHLVRIGSLPLSRSGVRPLGFCSFSGGAFHGLSGLFEQASSRAKSGTNRLPKKNRPQRGEH
jgi:hypothetical protein